MRRRTFIVLAAAGATGVTLGGVLATLRGPRGGPRFLARHPSGVWGLTDRPGTAGGVWARHPGGALGIAPPRTVARGMAMTEQGVVALVSDDRLRR